MTINSIGGTGAAAQAGAIGMSNDKTDKTAFDQILAAFEKEAAKTPAERARVEVLKKNNLTEDTYRALPPDQKRAIDAEIAVAVQRVMGVDKSKGFSGAASVAQVAPGASGTAAAPGILTA